MSLSRHKRHNQQLNKHSANQDSCEALEARINVILSGGIGIGRCLRQIERAASFKTLNVSIEDYCKTKWRWQPVQTRTHLAAADVVGKIIAKLKREPQVDTELIRKITLWGNEQAACALAKMKISEEKRISILREAFAKAAGSAGPSISHIKEAESMITGNMNVKHLDKRTEKKYNHINKFTSLQCHAEKIRGNIHVFKSKGFGPGKFRNDLKTISQELGSLKKESLERQSSKYKRCFGIPKDIRPKTRKTSRVAPTAANPQPPPAVPPVPQTPSTASKTSSSPMVASAPVPLPSSTPPSQLSDTTQDCATAAQGARASDAPMATPVPSGSPNASTTSPLARPSPTLDSAGQLLVSPPVPTPAQ